MTDLKGKIKREFNTRPPEEREWHLQNTWCEFCGIADLGMDKPNEYELNNKIFLSGYCLKCGNEIISEIID